MSSLEKYNEAMAMLWGLAHGYYSDPGLWIHAPDSPRTAVCKGWAGLYLLHTREIVTWWKEQFPAWQIAWELENDNANP